MVIASTAHAHFRIGKRSKFVGRQRPQSNQLPQNELLALFRRINNSHSLCQRFAKVTNSDGLVKEGDIADYVIDKIENDMVAKFKSHKQNPLSKYKALLDLVEEYCMQRALNAVLPAAASDDDELEIYRK